MKKLLEELGFTAKEADVYLALLEFGTQPASVIAKKTHYPKSTVLFLFDNLLKKGYLRKSNKGRVQYFYADPADLKRAKTAQMEAENRALEKAVQLLKEFKSPFTSEPKVTFFEGIEGCKKAYSLLLESKTEVLEFGAHGDLVEKLGQDFMNKFIAGRVKNRVFLTAVSKRDSIHKKLIGLNKKQMRKIKFYPSEKGTLYSSIAVFENKVLLVNLHRDAFAILIENDEVAETLKTIHRIIMG